MPANRSAPSPLRPPPESHRPRPPRWVARGPAPSRNLGRRARPLRRGRKTPRATLATCAAASLLRGPSPRSPPCTRAARARWPRARRHAGHATAPPSRRRTRHSRRPGCWRSASAPAAMRCRAGRSRSPAPTSSSRRARDRAPTAARRGRSAPGARPAPSPNFPIRAPQWCGSCAAAALSAEALRAKVAAPAPYASTGAPCCRDDERGSGRDDRGADIHRAKARRQPLDHRQQDRGDN